MPRNTATVDQPTDTEQLPTEPIVQPGDNAETVESTDADAPAADASLADVIEHTLSRMRRGGANYSVLAAGEQDGVTQLLVSDRRAGKNYAVQVKEIAQLFNF